MTIPASPNLPPASAKRRGIWARHWKWMIPFAVILVVLICAGVITLNLKSSARAIRASEPYQHAIARAMANADAVKVLGPPIAPGDLAMGDINIRGDTGDADFHFNLVGQWRSAIIHVVATRSAGKWTYSTINFLPHGGGSQIDLSYEGPPVSPNP